MAFRDELEQVGAAVRTQLATGDLTLTLTEYDQIGESGVGRPGYIGEPTEVTVRAVRVATFDELAPDIAGGHPSREERYRIMRADVVAAGMTVDQLEAREIAVSYAEDGGGLTLSGMTVAEITPALGGQALLVRCRR